jgi:hypothetical protein
MITKKDLEVYEMIQIEESELESILLEIDKIKINLVKSKSNINELSREYWAFISEDNWNTFENVRKTLHDLLPLPKTFLKLVKYEYKYITVENEFGESIKYYTSDNADFYASRIAIGSFINIHTKIEDSKIGKTLGSYEFVCGIFPIDRHGNPIDLLPPPPRKYNNLCYTSSRSNIPNGNHDMEDCYGYNYEYFGVDSFGLSDD